MSKKTNILIVDDDPGIRRVLSRYLTSVGYAVEAVESGEGMHQHLQHNQPDLFILDLHLPDTTGFELAKELRRKELKLIMLS